MEHEHEKTDKWEKQSLKCFQLRKNLNHLHYHLRLNRKNLLLAASSFGIFVKRKTDPICVHL